MTRTVPMAIGMTGAAGCVDAEAAPAGEDRDLRERCEPLAVALVLPPLALASAVAADADAVAPAALAFISATAAWAAGEPPFTPATVTPPAFALASPSWVARLGEPLLGPANTTCTLTVRSGAMITRA